MKINKIIAIALLTVGIGFSLSAQESTSRSTTKSKAWEFGLGGSVLQFNRTSFSNFSQLDDGGYLFDLQLKHTVYGANLYVARELNSHFYLDIQGTVGATESFSNNDKTKMYFMVGPGLQWRLGEYFGSKYIDPYFRAGINYMYKDFKIFYTGQEGLPSEEMSWILGNQANKDGLDRTHMMPVALGAGLNMWLNDRFGIGFQGDYLLMPYKNVANSLQGTVRLMYRIGGESKKPAPVVEYVEIERIVEKIIEKPVIVEKIVEKPCVNLYEFLNNINFEFDKADLTPESEKIVDEVANILKQHPNERYLITGYTDARGSVQYNEKLSKRRAATITKALIDRGVAKSSLKSRGVGSRVTSVQAKESDNIRNGDRKVTIELVNNMAYWNYLPENDF